MDNLKNIIVTDKDFYLSFEGRVSREQFLIHWFAPALVLSILATMIGQILPFVPAIFSLILLWPCIVLNTKRLHDRNRSGWVQLVLLIPVLGFLWWVYDCLVMPGIAGPNEYGDEPDHPRLADL